MDIMSKQKRSALMSRIKAKDTEPELIVRRLLHSLGFRYRLHLKSLPGRPDIVLPGKHAVILVHGCFWHRHHCGLAYVPKTRRAFWQAKFDRNVERDKRVQRDLRRSCW